MLAKVPIDAGIVPVRKLLLKSLMNHIGVSRCVKMRREGGLRLGVQIEQTGQAPHDVQSAIEHLAVNLPENGEYR